jgi:hypothetical protein
MTTGPVWADAGSILEAQPRLLVSSEAEDDDRFGTDIALADDLAALGASGVDGPTEDAGAVYVYRHNEGEWQESDVLRLENVGVKTRFGTALDLEDGWLAAGASGIYADKGAVYLYHENDGEWQQQTRLLPPDNTPQEVVFFGSSLDLHGETLVVGAPGYAGEAEETGLVMAYRRNGDGTWSDGTMLFPDAPLAGERFGSDVALDGERMLVGAAGTEGAVAAYLFEYRDGAWQQSARLSEDLGEDWAGYGEAVALHGDTALVAAQGATGDSGEPQGAVFAYTLNDGSWSRQAVLRSDAPARGDQFGVTLALDDGIALVAAPRDDATANDAGTVFLFSRDNDQWQLEGRLPRTDGGAYDNFGSGALVLDNGSAWVGTPAAESPHSDGIYTGTVTRYRP